MKTTEEQREIWKDAITKGGSIDLGSINFKDEDLLALLEDIEKLQKYICDLIYNITDGKMSKPYALSVVIAEVESIIMDIVDEQLGNVSSDILSEISGPIVTPLEGYSNIEEALRDLRKFRNLFNSLREASEKFLKRISTKELSTTQAIELNRILKELGTE